MSDDDEPMTSKSCMPAFIAIIFLAYFGVALFGPMFWPNLKGIEANMAQTLINLTIAAVSYYIGTTQQSAKKDETIASISKPEGTK